MHTIANKENFLVQFSLIALILIISGCASTTDNAPQTQSGQIQSDNISAARIALANGDMESASTYLKLALQADPLDSKAHYMLGSILASQGSDDQAIIGFQRAVLAKPTNHKALHNMGTLLLRRGEAIKAAELLELAVNRNPDYLPAYNNLAKAYYMAGLPELTVATYEEVLRREPENNVANRNLSILVAAKSKDKDEGPKGLLDEVKQDQAKREEKDRFAAEEKSKKIEADAKAKPGSSKKTGLKTLDSDIYRKLLRELPYVKVEEHNGIVMLTGWTRGDKEREFLNRILTKWPEILDLTGPDSGDPQRMLEVDAVLFIVIGFENESLGFNFLRLIDLSYTYFRNNTGIKMNELKGLEAPGFGSAIKIPSSGSLLIASVDYLVNIANATDERVSVLARPHLTTLNGTPAHFHAGGEWVFRVSGIEKGDIKPYPFGITVSVTPTLLLTPGEDGEPRVHLDIDAERKSVLEVLTAQVSEEDVVFDKLSINSQAVLGLDQTLILSGLNQKESRISNSGVPFVKEIPIVKYAFSQETTAETHTSIIILLTPRDPAFSDEQNRKSLSEFIEMRRAFVRAKRGSEEDMLRFQERYPDWRDLPPNRFASHFFLMENSAVYRVVSGEELLDEDLDLHLLDEVGVQKQKSKQESEQESAGANRTIDV